VGEPVRLLLPQFSDAEEARLRELIEKMSEFKVDQYHLDVEVGVVIKLRRRVETPGVAGLWWEVEFVVSGRVIQMPQNMIGRQLTEMEVIARVSA
jgi:hypothetical protein